MEDWMQLLKEAPVIAAVRTREQLLRACSADAAFVFILFGDLFTLPELVQQVQQTQKKAFVHMDFLEGIGKDAAGVRWIARIAKPAGVLSTKGQLLRFAAEEKMKTVLRMFLVDSASVEKAVRMAKSSSADLVEIMPGLLPHAIRWMREQIAQPIIAGGMLARDKDVEKVLQAGALGASTSIEALWGWKGGNEPWKR